MALWPFKRKGSRRRARQAVESPSGPPRAMTDSAAATMMTSAGVTGSTQRPRGGRSGSRKLQRRDRAYSFSPGRRDTLRVARARKEDVPPLPTGPIPTTSATFPNNGTAESHLGPLETADGQLRNRPPTLHHDNSRNKRRGQPLSRRKSSKRRKEDHDREIEIKAMSRPQPIRPATDSWTKGRPMKKDSKRVRPGLTQHWSRQDSDISLPSPESIHSAMSSDSEQMSWKVTGLDSLAPRPTLRYSSGSAYGLSSGSGPTRTTSQKRKLAEKESLPEAILKAHKRIDSLADDLDAADIRELMERDRRRREQKKNRERERAERRLARRAEKQREEEAEAKRNGTPPPQNLERGVLGRDMAGLGIDPTSAVVTSSRRRSPSIEDSPRKKEKQPAQSNVDEPKRKSRSPSPLEEFHRTESIPLEPSMPVKVAEAGPTPEPTREPVAVSTPPRRRSPSPRLMDFLRSKKRRSQSPLHTDEERIETPERKQPSESTRVTSKSSESDSARQSDSGSARPWASLFRWGKSARNRRSPGPSSFSNTSRDSMLANQTPTAPTGYMPVQKKNPNVPKRTMSRFREDLPEFPISPPDSRVASPEAEVPANEPLPVITDDVVMRYDTPTSVHRATPISMHRNEAQNSPEPQSMSLASIDSEASWLSGGRRKRTSSGMYGSIANYSMRSPSAEPEEHETDDDDAVADDEFLKTMVDDRLHRKSTGEARPSSDEENEVHSPIWGAVNQTPTVVRHTGTMKSREGLFQSYDEGNQDSSDDDLQSDFGTPGVPQRATSIDLKKGHVRKISAGSAKLLDIAPRKNAERRSSSNVSTSQ